MICKDLIDEGAILFIHDPKVVPEQIASALDKKKLSLKNIKDQNDFLKFEGQWCLKKIFILALKVQMQ